MPFCIAIKANINVPTCPLGKGQCYWQNTLNECCYTADDLTVEQFCELTGRTLPQPEASAAIAAAIKKSLTL